jgi:hypothetical protein
VSSSAGDKVTSVREDLLQPVHPVLDRGLIEATTNDVGGGSSEVDEALSDPVAQAPT